jgi:predicted O-methyltransferase YrrM
MPKTMTAVTSELYSYIQDNWSREPEVLQELSEETEKLEMSAMQISPDQGQFMAFLVGLIDARKIIEVGTFTGYSALVMALATHQDSKIVCCDISQEWTNIAKRYWEKAGVSHKIDLRLAPAIGTLKKLKSVELGTFDFAFIDADKTNYDNYFEFCLELVRPGAIIAIDNVFWGGWVAEDSQQDDDTKAIRALNKKLKTDERIELSIVPIGDGLTLARKL